MRLRDSWDLSVCLSVGRPDCLTDFKLTQKVENRIEVSSLSFFFEMLVMNEGIDLILVTFQIS